MLKINYLASGGIITNYKCSSKCKHCVYASSPSWPNDYMTSSIADEVFSILKELACDNVHIGGGEPLLQPERIYPVLESARRHNIGIDYLETNASWYKDESSAKSVLRELMKRGVNSLLISIDPYHNEYIPFYKVKGLIEACSKVNMGVFPWLMDFWNDLDTFDDSKPHSLEEYADLFGEDYLRKLPKRYGLNIRGRALKTYKSILEMEPFDRIIKNSSPCSLLSGIHHFHVDLYGNFIPQSCAGLSIKLSELWQGADPKKYPIFYRLDSVGIRGLVELAVEEYGYSPKAEYAGECDLCHDIRSYLVLDQEVDLPDLQPTDHYRFL
ncbi:MAG: radical SAM protein [Clostridiales bacterium]|nr:radical SAM protein [Clostridiales bacterium]